MSHSTEPVDASLCQFIVAPVENYSASRTSFSFSFSRTDTEARHPFTMNRVMQCIFLPPLFIAVAAAAGEGEEKSEGKGRHCLSLLCKFMLKWLFIWTKGSNGVRE